jgi:AcrR family transcriptional regulator
VEDCGMNRQTFYYHFHDVYDLIQWILEEESQAALASDGRMDNWKNHIRDVLEAMLQQKSLVLNIVHSLNREHLEQYLCGVIDTFIYDSLKTPVSLVVSMMKIFIADFSPNTTPSWASCWIWS